MIVSQNYFYRREEICFRVVIEFKFLLKKGIESFLNFNFAIRTFDAFFFLQKKFKKVSEFTVTFTNVKNMTDLLELTSKLFWFQERTHADTSK